MTLAPGTTLGRYQILEPLGQGGMATVYKAFQPSLEREVALKVLRPGYAQDPEFRERFEREAKAIAKLRHPHIVQVFDFEVASSGEYVLAMEFLDGGTLKDRLSDLTAAGRRPEPRESVRIVSEVAEALDYAHEQGVIHRDVKPSNVMLTRKDWAVVTDFGIARILGATSHTQTGVGIGTPEYMAPEQGQGTGIDHRADIYSLGAMAYELLVGRVPYTADTPLAVVLAHIKDPLPLPSKVNPTIGTGVERALLKALAKDPAQRFDSATAFAEALSAGLAEDSRGGTMPTVMVRAAAPAAAAPRAPAAAPNQVTLSIPPILTERPVAFGVAGALVVALVVGTVAVSGALRSSPAATTAPPAPAATVAPPTPVSGAGQPAAPAGPGTFAAMHGAVVFAPKLDGTPGEITFNGAQGAGKVGSGALELTTPDGGQQVEAVLNTPAGTQYAADMHVFFTAGSFMRFAFCPRMGPPAGATAPGGNATYCLTVLARGREGYSIELRFQDLNAPPDRIGDVVTLPVAAAFTLAMVVDRSTFTAFIDDKLIQQRTDTRIPEPATPPVIQVSRLGSNPNDTGTARIDAVHVYRLAGAVAPVAPAPAGTRALGSPPKFAIPAKGAQIEDKPMNAALFGGTNQGGQPNRADLRFTPDGAVYTVTQPRSALNGDVARMLADPDHHVVEYELSVAPGSDIGLQYVLRQYAFQSDAQKAYGSYAIAVGLNALDQVLVLHAAPPERIDVPSQGVAGVADLQKGRTVTVAIVVDHPTYTVFLDQKQVARFSASGDTGSSRPAVAVFGNSGSVTLRALRYYELPK